MDIESIFIIQNIISTLTKQGKALLIMTGNLENAIMMSSNVYRLNADGLKKIDIVEDEDNQEEKHEKTIKEEKTLNEENEEDPPLNLAQFRFEKIPVKFDDKIILLDPTEIDFIESSEGVSNVHVKGEVFPCSYTLNQLFDRLYPFGFFRSHRSYIVNLQKVREVITWTRNSYSLILDDSKKSSVPLSKGKLNELKEIIRM
ncbi:LytTR family DNA-binding domain-containing protein [Pueribacillus theae]|uniref:LytTR family DNA-binding domain-containing protein n=1 Tax=Pueribacillus theae TaxID=2171751 RepID=UPI001F0B9C21|nr:LytTR family DNA-binding domain-containing protein [Pueribacillus theae]